MPTYPKTAAYQECFASPGDNPAVAWDLDSFSGSIAVPLPYVAAGGVHLDGYWLSDGDNGGASLFLMDPLGLTDGWIYDLTESSVAIGVVSVPDPLLNSGQGQLRLAVASSGLPAGPGVTIVEFTCGGPIGASTLRCTVQIDTAGSPDVFTLFSATYAGERHWRLRLTGATLYAETALDPVTATSPTWVTRGSLADSRLPVGLGQCGVDIDTNFGAAVVRYYNGGCLAALRCRQWSIE
jgi:hypothetical protein